MGPLRYWGVCCQSSINMKPITTLDVCRALGLTEPGLRHVLRRPDAPRPRLHPSARLFLWSEQDVQELAAYLGRSAEKRVVIEVETGGSTNPAERSAGTGGSQ